MFALFQISSRPGQSGRADGYVLGRCLPSPVGKISEADSYFSFLQRAESSSSTYVVYDPPRPSTPHKRSFLLGQGCWKVFCGVVIVLLDGGEVLLSRDAKSNLSFTLYMFS